MLSNSLTALGALLLGAAIAHVSPWWALAWTGAVLMLGGFLLAREANG